VWIIHLIFSLVTVLAALVTAITVSGNQRRLRQADCIVVPGAKVCADGTPSSMLAARINNAVRLYHEGWANAILFTGGAGTSGPIESEAAREYAMRLGVPPARLFVERLSHTTYENFYQARAVMRAEGWRTCLVSTDPFHVLRCLVIARGLGIHAWGAPAFSSPGYTRLEIRAFYTLRECAGLVRYGWQRLTAISSESRGR
jgi:uncharacterized SAM-binding protein YcdF (DUF218 family)